MSITPYKGNEVTVWRPHRLGQYLSFHTHRMYYFLKNVAPVLVKHEVRQIGRDAVDVIPFISSDAKRDIKRWLGDYDPRHFSSTFHSVWADFDVIDHGTKGMAIHFSFSVAGLKDLCCEAAIYFYYEGGARLQDFNGLYGSYDGQVAVSSDFTPDYHNTIYGDFSIFMPYSELHMAPGKHDLAYLIQLYSKRCGTRFGSSSFQSFLYRC